MSTKAEYIEFIQFELCGGQRTPDNLKKYPLRMIANRCNEVYKLMLNEIYLTTKKKRDYSAFDLYSKSFRVQVMYDKDTDRRYSVLPKAIISMPLEVVIRKITPLKDMTTSFIPISMGQVEVLSKLPVGDMDGLIYNYIENDRVYYWHLPNDIKNVNMSLVCNFSEFSPKDLINTPTGTMGTMFDRVVQSLRGLQVTPEKQVNDNQATQVNMSKR